MGRNGLARPGRIAGAAVADADVELLDGVSRLVGLLDKPDQLSVRAPLLMRELHYLLLLGPYGGALRRLNTLGSQNNQVVQAIDWLRRNVAQPGPFGYPGPTGQYVDVHPAPAF